MSKITKNKLENIRKKVRTYGIKNQHKKGIKFLQSLFNNEEGYSKNERLQLDMAFILYHESIKHLFKKKISKKQEKESEKQIEKAIKICKRVLYGKSRSKDTKNIINARMFLAQIYAILNKPHAIYLAKENFNQEPGIVTANRLADVYFRLGKIKLAETWYKKYENLALKEGCPTYQVFANMAVFYKEIQKEKHAQEYFRRAFDSLPKTPEAKSVILILKKYFNFRIENGSR